MQKAGINERTVSHSLAMSVLPWSIVVEVFLECIVVDIEYFLQPAIAVIAVLGLVTMESETCLLDSLCFNKPINNNVHYLNY